MRRLAEVLAFTALAIGAHLVALSLRASDTGLVASGEGGEALMSLQASTASIEELVEQWEKPPQTATPRTPPKLVQPKADAPTLEQPATPDAPSLPALPKVAGLAMPQPEALPDTDATAPPSPPVPPTPEPEPEQDEPENIEQAQPEIADIRPQARPERPKQPARKAPREKNRKQKKNSAASAGQRASGQGGGQQAGLGSTSAAATLSKGQRQTLMSQWGAQVRARIERRKKYPRAARGVSGTVRLRVAVGSNGALQSVSIAQSSGNAHIDQASLRAVQSARKFPAAPKGLAKPVYSFTLPMSFSN